MIQMSELRTSCPDCGETLIKDFKRMLCLNCGRYYGSKETDRIKTISSRSEKQPIKIKDKRGKLNQGKRKACIRIQHHWTDEEKEIVRVDYKQTRASIEAIVDRLWQERSIKVTPLSVRGQVQMLGLGRSTSKKWDETQDRRLRELAGKYAMTTIARKMGRSINSVVVRSKRLGIYRRECRDGWYNKKEVCEFFGVDHRRVRYFIDTGMLRASYHHEHKPSQRSGACEWHIEEEAIASFIRRHPEELNGRNVDLIRIVQILMRSNNGKLPPM